MKRSIRIAASVSAAGVLGVLVPASLLAYPSVAGASGGPTAVVLSVTSAQANPGDVEVTDESGTTVDGTCVGLSTAGTNKCTIPVPSNSGVLLISQPSAGEEVTAWSSVCAGSPGPICHVQAGGAHYSKKITVTIGPAAAGSPTLSTSQPFLAGDAPGGCDPGQSVTVTGSGFPADTPATLSDDGNLVDSGATDGSGNVQLTDGPGPSDPGIYRTLTLTAGAATGSTDVYNALFSCLSQNPPPPTQGSVSVTADLSGLDANSMTSTIKFKGHPLVTIPADSTGAGSTTTPTYTCKVGKTYTAALAGDRGAGTPEQYKFKASFTVTC